MGRETKTRASNCTMHLLLYVTIGHEVVVFRMITEVTVRKEDGLHRREVKTSEERVERVTASSKIEVPNIIGNDRYSFVALLRG